MVVEVLGSTGRCRRDGPLDILHIAGDNLVRSHAELGLVASRLVRIRFVACICWVRLVKHNVAIVIHFVHRLAISRHIGQHRLVTKVSALGHAAVSLVFVLLLFLIWVHFTCLLILVYTLCDECEFTDLID